MGHSAGQAADGFHLLGLAELVLEHATVGNVFGNRLQHVGWFVDIADGAAADADSDGATIFALPLDFDAIEASGATEFVDEVGVLFGVREYILFRIEQQNFLGRTIRQHGDESGIDVEEPAFQAGAIDSVDRTLHQRPIASLGAAEGLFVSLDLNRAGHLPRHESQNLFVAFAIADVLGIGLNHERAESMVVDLERHTHPIERTRTVAGHLAAVFHALQDLRRCQQRLSDADEIVGESSA